MAKVLFNSVRITAPGDPWEPELPRSEPNISLPSGWDATAHVTPANASALTTDLAEANQDNSGVPYIIELTAGSTYSGEFTLPAASGNDWLIIRSSAFDTDLPTTGIRVISNTGMAKIESSTIDAKLIRNTNGTNRVRFIGIEFSQTNTANANYGMVRCDVDTWDNVIFDRCYVHGVIEGNVNDGILLKNGGSFALINSRIDTIQTYPGLGQSENHGINLQRVTGPSLIENNYIEAAGINIFTGGTTNNYPVEQLCQDLTVRGNLCTKNEDNRTVLDASGYVNDGKQAHVKNLLETKEGTRILVEGNKFEKCWPGAGSQHGVGLVFKSNDGSCSDYTIRNNWIDDTDWGLHIQTTNSGNYFRRIKFHDNLFVTTPRQGSPDYGDYARSIFISSNLKNEPLEYLTIENNTFYTEDAEPLTMWFTAGDQTLKQFIQCRVKNNIFTSVFMGSAPVAAAGYPVLEENCSYYDWNKNLLRRTSGTYAESGNFKNWIYATGTPEIDFTSDTPSGVVDFKLTPDSSGYQAGTNNKDIGCDTDAITGALND